MKTTTIAKLNNLIESEINPSNFGYARNILSTNTSRIVRIDSAKMLLRRKPELLRQALELI
jgi:hypothetical protein